MKTTPDDIKWWKLRRWNAKSFELLLEKSIDLHESNVPYSVNFGEMHGFQQGDLSRKPYRVELDLFDKSDRHYMIFIIGGHDEQQASISQAETNGMISSMKSRRLQQARYIRLRLLRQNASYGATTVSPGTAA